MIPVSWPLKLTRSTIFSRLERLVSLNVYFCKIWQLTVVQLNWFLFIEASWRIQGNGCYPSLASSAQRAVNDKTVGACWQRIFSKKAASSPSLLIFFFVLLCLLRNNINKNKFKKMNVQLKECHRIGKYVFKNFHCTILNCVKWGVPHSHIRIICSGTF